MSTLQTPVRTRFAPSPTGYLHIGSLRTVLFSWLYARRMGGQFLLRIEDTDRKRLVADAEQQILEALSRMGLTWDEGPDKGGLFAPYRQSERLAIYRRYSDELLTAGVLYKCWCTSERLTAVNDAKKVRKEAPGYDRHCRCLSASERAELEKSGSPFTLRLAVPLDGQTVVHDLVRGAIIFDNALQHDQVMVKSDGYPTYHFAVVIDDHEMQISHVVRGEEWISTAPLHVLLYKALGWTEPAWVHVPAVLGPDGKKLSKRHGATSVCDYLDKGYLPEALINFLALVGWSAGDNTEIMGINELIARFDLRQITTSGGVFNLDKLNHFNGLHIRRLSVARLGEYLIPFLKKDGLLSANPTNAELDMLKRLVPLLQERLVLLGDAPPMVRSFFRTPVADPGLLVPANQDSTVIRDALSTACNTLSALKDWVAAELDLCMRDLAEQLKLKKPLFMALRVAVTGSTVSLPLCPTMEIIGRDETLARIRRAVECVPVASK